jgi:hypothetical protein
MKSPTPEIPAVRATAAFLLAIALVALVVSAAAVDTSPTAIFASPDRFDGQTVTITGSITSLRERVSARGNPYYTFDLSDGTRAIRVFSFGRRPCQDGSPVRVTGRFYREHRVGRYVFSDEVTATSVTCR